MKFWGTTKLIIFSFIIINPLLAGTIRIPINDLEVQNRPAQDLIYNGHGIDSYEAFELQRSGEDLSLLNPKISNLWKGEELPLKKMILPAGRFKFVSIKASPTEFFRATVQAQNNKLYTITASLKNHSSIVNSNILRKLGYDIATPRLQKLTAIDFKSSHEKEQFLTTLGEQTLTNKKRWVSEESEKSLNLKDLTIEESKLENVNIFLPLMSRSRQEKRRIFRALLAVYEITDFSQSINKTPWETASRFNGYLNITHPYATEFSHTSSFDLKWILRKLNSLTKKDWKDITSFSTGYPTELLPLITEKLISRSNSLMKHLDILPSLTPNLNITSGPIQNGRLTKNTFQNYVVEFYSEDQESPFRFSELFTLFRNQATYNILSTALREAVEKFVPGFRVSDAVKELQSKIQTYRSSTERPEALSLKSFSAPLANVNARMNRNIVFGNYLGNSAPIQLVDSVSVDANIGLYTLFPSLDDQITPSVTTTAQYSRSYSHVRAMPDLSTATSQSLKKLLVPKLMTNLSQIIKNEFLCSLTDTINIQETEINHSPVVYIKYDLNTEGAKDLAIRKREELIASGVNEDIILLIPIDNKIECEKEVFSRKKENLNTFLKEFAQGETFIITDSINLSILGNANIPIGLYSGTQLSANIGANYNKGLLSTIILRKKEETLEISIQKQNQVDKGGSLGVSYFIELLKASKEFFKGKIKTKLYQLPLNPETEFEYDFTLKILSDLFSKQSNLSLQDKFFPKTLYHQANGKLNSLEILWRKLENFEQEHTVTIQLPKENYPGVPTNELKKTLFSHSLILREGTDFLSLFNKILNTWSQYLNFAQESADPGQSFGGKSKTRYYIGESLVPSQEKYPPLFRVEYLWRGWSTSESKRNQIFNEVESILPKEEHQKHIDRSRFSNFGKLKGYEIKSTILLYPSAVQKINTLLSQRDGDIVKKLKDLYGERKWQHDCFKRSQGINRNIRRRKCILPHAQLIIYLAHLKKVKVQDQVKFLNNVISTLFENYPNDKVLAFLGNKNLFMTTRITGFLENSHTGFIDYISNSYGSYHTNLGTGLFDSYASILGISPFELRARSFAPGM